MNDKPIFDAIRDLLKRGLTQPEVDRIEAAIAEAVGFPKPKHRLKASTAIEIICHEGIVLEAYRDSKGIWTWSIGLTAAAGVDPLLHKDRPSTLEAALAAYIDRLVTKYLPDVLKAFHGVTLTDEQLTAALSFHYNTGAILRADWVQSFLAGNYDVARREIMNWRSPKEIIPRREAERDLFFDGKLCSDGLATIYPVKKPSYTPDWGGAKRVDVRPIIEKLLT